MSSPSAESLLQHEPFVRSVVRTLLADDARVDDVLQETWLRALRRPPRDEGSLRGWLARVAANLARDLGRAGSRRRRREEASARPEALESVDVTHERLAAQREVVDVVLALEEPYRSVILLRHWQDLSTAEIARRLGRSPATVRSQLSRAHGHLRESLDARFDGGREVWAGLLLPLLSRDAAVAGGAAGGGVALVKVAAAALLLVGLGYLGRPPSGPSGDERTTSGEGLSADEAESLAVGSRTALTVGRAEAAEPSRRALGTEEVEVAVEDSSVRDPGNVNVLVVDSDRSEPVAGYRLYVSPPGGGGTLNTAAGLPAGFLEWAETDETGRATFRVPPGTAFGVRSFNPPYPTLSRDEAPLAPDEVREVRVLVSKEAVDFHVRLVDTGGRPRAGVEIRVTNGTRMGSELIVLETVISDEQGYFRVRQSPLQGLFCTLEDPRLTPFLIPITVGHESPGEALRVEVPEVASLDVALVEPPPGATRLRVVCFITARVRPRPMGTPNIALRPLERIEPIDPAGPTGIDDLPATVALQLELLDDAGEVLARHGDPLVLAERETRLLVWSLARELRSVDGVVVDDEGQPGRSHAAHRGGAARWGGQLLRGRVARGVPRPAWRPRLEPPARGARDLAAGDGPGGSGRRRWSRAGGGRRRVGGRARGARSLRRGSPRARGERRPGWLQRG